MGQFSWQWNDGDIPLLMEVQNNFNPVSGLSPTVELRHALNDRYADWATQTFKDPNASGDRLGTMTEVSGISGLYRRLFNPKDFGQNKKQQVYIATYRATIPSGSAGITEDTDIIASEIHHINDFAGSGTLGMTVEFC